MNLKYRPEIDGLRAIAVLAVIFYHSQIKFFNINFFNGGFIGVDIFFVISGYLISSIILKELYTTGKFSFSYFYERRARRLLPVLFLVMLFSMPAAWIYLLPNTFIDFSKSILSSLIFSSNFYFWIEGQQYATQSALLKPFLHTWSLSVEEQFYIIFPLFLLFVFKFFKKYLLLILFFIIFLSLMLATWGSYTSPSFNFYMLTSRLWELLAGAALASLELRYGRKSKIVIAQSLSFLGIALIIYSIIFFNDKMLHPSFYTILPIIGVMLLIWFLNEKLILNTILSSKLFVSIGLISYSLYLWHYPIMAFDRIKDFSPSESDKMQWIFLTFLFSIISYFLVEKPFRNKKKISKKTLFISVSLSFLLISAINFYTIKSNGFINSLAGILQKEFKNIEPKNRLKDEEGRICHRITIIKDACNFNKNGKRKVFLVGDSNLATFMYELKNKLIDEDYEFLARTNGGCWYLPNFIREELNKKAKSKQCNLKYRNDLRKELLSNPNSILIIGGRLPLYLSRNYFDNKEGGVENETLMFNFKHIENKYNFKDGFRFYLSEILDKKIKVILVYPIPEVGWNVPNKIFKDSPKRYIKKIEKNYYDNPITTSFKVYKERTKESFKLLDSFQNKNINRVYPHTLFCNTQIKNRCLTHDDKNIFYFDDNHLSSAGSSLLVDLIIKEIKKIEAK